MQRTVTAIANKFTEQTDNGNFRHRNNELLAAWMPDNINADCILADISDSGAAVLVPVKNRVPVDFVDLTIMSIQHKTEILTVVRARKCWIDEEYSDEYRKVGLEFQHVNLHSAYAISSLIKLIIRQQDIIVKCRLRYR